MRIIAKLRHPAKRGGLYIQNGIIMPIRQDMDKIGLNHSCTMIVSHIPEEVEVRDIQTFAYWQGGNNGFTAVKTFINVRRKDYITLAISVSGEKAFTKRHRFFAKPDIPFSVGDDIFVSPKAVAKYYQENKPDESRDTFEVFIDDIVGYKKLGEKVFRETNNYVMGYPTDDQDKIVGAGLIGVSVIDYKTPVRGLFKAIDGTVYKGYGEKYPFLTIVGREGDAKMCYWYPKTGFYATFKRVRGIPVLEPLNKRLFIEFEVEETKLMIKNKKPLLTGTVIAPDTHQLFGKRVVYDLFMFPFEYYKDDKKHNCVAVFEENIRIVL